MLSAGETGDEGEDGAGSESGWRAAGRGSWGRKVRWQDAIGGSVEKKGVAKGDLAPKYGRRRRSACHTGGPRRDGDGDAMEAALSRA